MYCVCNNMHVVIGNHYYNAREKKIRFNTKHQKCVVLPTPKSTFSIKIIILGKNTYIFGRVYAIFPPFCCYYDNYLL